MTMLFCGLLLILFQAIAAGAQTNPATFHFVAEWRGMRAGVAQLTLKPDSDAWQASLHMETTGLVGKLYKVNSDYTSFYDKSYCTSAVTMRSNEGKKRRETSVVFQQPPGTAKLEERDLLKNTVVERKTIDVPPCVHDLLASLGVLRSMKLEPGKSFELPLSDGKKSISARVAVRKIETVRFHSRSYKTVQLEAFLYNGIFYRRKGRLLIWLTDDEDRLPVRIQIQQPFYIGTVTLEIQN